MCFNSLSHSWKISSVDSCFQLAIGIETMLFRSSHRNYEHPQARGR